MLAVLVFGMKIGVLAYLMHSNKSQQTAAF